MRGRKGAKTAGAILLLACACGPEGPAIAPAVSGTLTPRFVVTHVTYAALANARIDYHAAGVFGATMSVTRSFKDGVAVDASHDPVAVLAGGGFEVAAGLAWGGTRADTSDLTLRRTEDEARAGRTDILDHGEDEIWLLPKPELAVAVTPASGATAQRVKWQFASRPAGAVPFSVQVRELRNPSTMRPAVKERLDQNGITAGDYPEILKADPFAAGATAIDRDRFVVVSTFPFIPRPTPDFLPSTQTFMVTRAAPSASTSPQEVSYSTAVELTGPPGFTDLLRSSLATPDTLTWTASTVTGTPAAASTAATSVTITVDQPPFDYAGPTILRVHFDKIWKSYLLAFDPL